MGASLLLFSGTAETGNEVNQPGDAMSPMGKRETLMKTWGWASIGLAVALSVASSVRADEPSGGPTARPKSVRIPVSVAEAAREGLASLNLFVSLDRGKTWRLAETITPEDKPAFRFNTAGQGTYWLACQTVSKGGRKLPGSVEALAPAIVVTVKGDDVIVAKP